MYVSIVSFRFHSQSLVFPRQKLLSCMDMILWTGKRTSGSETERPQGPSGLHQSPPGVLLVTGVLPVPAAEAGGWWPEACSLGGSLRAWWSSLADQSSPLPSQVQWPLSQPSPALDLWLKLSMPRPLHRCASVTSTAATVQLPESYRRGSRSAGTP